MSTSYWLSFRLHDKGVWRQTYNRRLNDLHGEMSAASGDGANLWFDTTSFYVFRSEEEIDDIVVRVKRAIDEAVDLVVIGMNDFIGARVVGDLVDLDILKLVSGIAKV